MIEKVYAINRGLDKRFPNGRNPFQIMTRLLEECGELAAEVNHFEDSGVKRQKHGEPKPKKLAKEVQDVIRSALQIATYYDVEAELEASIVASYERMVEDRLIEREWKMDDTDATD